MSLEVEEYRTSETGTQLEARRQRGKERSERGLEINDNEPCKADGLLFVVIYSRPLIRDCLVRCLRAEIGHDAVAAYASLKDWAATARDNRKPSLLLVFACTGKDLQEQTESELAELSRTGELPPTILLSDTEDADEILEALDMGARGFIPTSVPLDVAVGAMQLVRAGGTFVPAGSLLSARRNSEAASEGRKSRIRGLFTERQEAVVEAIRQGKANKIIAYELNMQESTVKVHVRNIMKKLNARNRTEVAYLTRNMFDDNA